MLKIFVKINRISAWILLVGIFLYFVSGFGMTKGFISPSLASKIHLSFLTYVIALAFIFHSSFGIYLSFKRWGIWNKVTATLMISIFVLLFALLIFVDKFYKKEPVSESSSDSTNQISQNSAEVNNQASNAQTGDTINQGQRTFTEKELALYNGQNGQPAYVAVDGKVYDLSSVFINGEHHSYYAGKDLTGPFFQHHIRSVLAKYPIVGTLVK